MRTIHDLISLDEISSYVRLNLLHLLYVKLLGNLLLSSHLIYCQHWKGEWIVLLEYLFMSCSGHYTLNHRVNGYHFWCCVSLLIRFYRSSRYCPRLQKIQLSRQKLVGKVNDRLPLSAKTKRVQIRNWTSFSSCTSRVLLHKKVSQKSLFRKGANKMLYL